MEKLTDKLIGLKILKIMKLLRKEQGLKIK